MSARIKRDSHTDVALKFQWLSDRHTCVALTMVQYELSRSQDTAAIVAVSRVQQRRPGRTTDVTVSPSRNSDRDYPSFTFSYCFQLLFVCFYPAIRSIGRNIKFTVAF